MNRITIPTIAALCLALMVPTTTSAQSVGNNKRASQAETQQERLGSVDRARARANTVGMRKDIRGLYGTGRDTYTEGFQH